LSFSLAKITPITVHFRTFETAQTKAAKTPFTRKIIKFTAAKYNKHFTVLYK